MIDLPSLPNDYSVDDQFEYILETSRQLLLSVANSRMSAKLLAKGGASDMVQNTLHAAIQNREQFRGRSTQELKQWLLTILDNEIKQFERSYRSTKSRDIQSEEHWDANQIHQIPHRESNSPQFNLELQEEHQQLQFAYSRLDEESRQVIHLRLDLEKSYEEIGILMNRSSEAARKHFDRSLERLKNLVNEQTQNQYRMTDLQ